MMALSLSSYAQTNRFEQRYNMLVSKFGPAGVGVETLLDNWEAADSTDAKVHIARFQFWMEKAKTEQIVSKAEKKYLGMSPLFSLKDSTGTDVHYYQETFYDDEIYGNAIKAVDKAIALRPSDLEYRFMKANAYIAYEKGSPDMALVYLQRLSDMHGDGITIPRKQMRISLQMQCRSIAIVFILLVLRLHWRLFVLFLKPWEQFIRTMRIS